MIAQPSLPVAWASTMYAPHVLVAMTKGLHVKSEIILLNDQAQMKSNSDLRVFEDFSYEMSAPFGGNVFKVSIELSPGGACSGRSRELAYRCRSQMRAMLL